MGSLEYANSQESDVQIKNEILETAAEIAPEFFSREREHSEVAVVRSLILLVIQALLAFPVKEGVESWEEVT